MEVNVYTISNEKCVMNAPGHLLYAPHLLRVAPQEASPSWLLKIPHQPSCPSVFLTSSFPLFQFSLCSGRSKSVGAWGCWSSLPLPSLSWQYAGSMPYRAGSITTVSSQVAVERAGKDGAFLLDGSLQRQTMVAMTEEGCS